MRKFFLLILTVMLLSGCYDSKEPNDIAYIVAVGIDLTENEGMYEYTIQFAKTTQISGGSSQEGGKEGSNIVELINVKAPTVYSGINIANQTVSKSFTLAHTKLIVISDELAKKGVKDLFDTFGRNSDIRPDLYLAVSNGKAKDYLDSVKPIVEVNPVSYYRLIFQSEQGGYVPRTELKDFYFHLDDYDKENILPLAGVNEENKNKEKNKEDSEGENEEKKGNDEGSKSKKSGDENEKNVGKINKRGFDFLTKEYTAGEIDVEKKNASEVMGMAVFKDDRMIGKMNNIECVVYNMLSGTLKNSYIAYYDIKYPQVPLTILLEQIRKPKISVDTDLYVPKISIKIYMEGELMSEAIESMVEDRIKETEKQIEEQTKKVIEDFLKKTTSEFDTDIIGFGRYAKKNFLTYNDYRAYEWKNKYALSQFDVDVNFEMRRIGFIDLGKED